MTHKCREAGYPCPDCQEEQAAINRLGDLKRAHTAAFATLGVAQTGNSKGSSAAQPQRAVLLKAPEPDYEAKYNELRAKMDEIHGWIVCACISTPEDMMQNAARIEELSRPD